MFPDCPGASRGLWRGHSTLLWLMPTASTSSSNNREMILTTKPPPTSTAVGYTGAARSSHFSQSAKQTVFKDMLREKLWSYQTSAENSSNTSFLCGSGTVCCREQLKIAPHGLLGGLCNFHTAETILCESSRAQDLHQTSL